MLNLLTFNGVYLPGYKAGGPIRSIANLARHLQADVCLHVVTRDRDAGDVAPYKNVEVNKWVRLTHESVYYQRANEFSTASLRRIVNSKKFDGVLLHGIFSEYTFRFLLLRKLGLVENFPVILMPHGDLSAGALSIKSVKKSLFLALARVLHLYDSLQWLTTSESEKHDINRRFIGLDVAVIANLPFEPILNLRRGVETKNVGSLNVAYIARITPIKNLLFALRILNQVDGMVTFNIYGPVTDPKYWGMCKCLIGNMRANITVKYHGSVLHNEIETVLHKCDLLFLPTLGENYGHVIVESLTCGVPVVISNQTPWRGLTKAHAGWDIALSNEREFVRAIQLMVNADSLAYTKYRQGAKSYILKHVNTMQIKAQYKYLFSKVYNSVG